MFAANMRILSRFRHLGRHKVLSLTLGLFADGFGNFSGNLLRFFQSLARSAFN